MDFKTSEFASQMTFSGSMLNLLADEQRVKSVKRAMEYSLVDYLVVNGQRAVAVDTNFDDSDPSMRGAIELNVTGQAIPELNLLALTARQSKRQEALAFTIFQVNNISWWKFLWLKLKGKQLVEL